MAGQAEGRLDRPYPVQSCENPECHAPLDRDAYLLHDKQEGVSVVYCDRCAESALEHHPERFKLVLG